MNFNALKLYLISITNRLTDIGTKLAFDNLNNFKHEILSTNLKILVTMNLRLIKAVWSLLMFTYALPAYNEENGRMINYIEQFKHLAVQEMQRTQIPASIKLAQAILESQAGTSTLALKANNHFGIKCGDKWTGETYYIKDDDYDKHGNHIQSCFRVYADPSESFVAHSSFITGEGRTTNRYASLFLLPRDDYKGWAEGLQKAGYATHPLYAKRLVNIIENYQLFQYDTKATFRTPEAPPGFFMDKYKSPFTKVNGLKSVYVDYMASPAEIAIDFNVPLEMIMKYNDALENENAPINTPMYVFLEKKKKKSSDRLTYHIVKQGETVESISQTYGIQSKYLYRRNRIEKGSQPAVGSKIYLNRKSKYTPDLVTYEATTQYSTITATTTPETPAPAVPAERNENNLKTVRTPLEQTFTTKESNDESTESTDYTVLEKDTLYSIAKKFNTTVDAIKQINQLNQDQIKIGQVLRIK